MSAVRYVGQKPFNWPAAILIFGWFGLALVLFGGGQTFISLFGRTLVGVPLYWWPEMSGLGFAGVIAPMVLGAFALWVMPRADWSPRLGASLVATGYVLFLLGLGWDVGSGVAVYPDRVVHRPSGWRQPTQTEHLRDVARIETACVFETGRRGQRLPNFDYRARFASGYDLWLNWGATLFGLNQQYEQKLRTVKAIDSAANTAGATRAPRRDINGNALGDRGCVDRLAERYGVTRGEIADLFVVHQDQLRPGEYTTVPTPQGVNR